MSYDRRLLFAQICLRLDATPALSLLDLTREFHVGSRTIQKAVASMTGGVKFTSFKDDVLIARLTRQLLARPSSPINEISSDLGYKSTRTFARALRHACGATPAEFRSRIVGEAAKEKVRSLKASATVN